MFMMYEVTQMSRRGLSGSEIGVLLAIENALLLVAGTLWGRLADRFACYREIVAGSSLGLSFGLFWLSQADSLADFAFYVCLRGLLFGAMTNTMTALAMANLKSTTPGRGFSAFRLFGSIGFMSGSFLFPILYSDLDQILIAGACLLPLCLFFVLPLKNPPRNAQERASATSAKLPVSAYWFLAAHFLVCFSEPANVSFLNDYLSKLGGSAQLMGWHASFMGLMALVSLPIMGRLVDGGGLRWVIALGFLFQAARPLWISLIESPGWLWTTHFCHVFGWAGREVAAIVLMIALLGPQKRATAVALISALRMAGTLVGSLLMGHLSELYGYPFTFQLIAGLSACSLPCLILALKRPEQG